MDFAKPGRLRAKERGLRRGLWFREVESGPALPRTAPRSGLGFAKPQGPNPCGGGAGAGGKFREAAPSPLRPADPVVTASFARFTSPGSLARLRETGALPDPGSERAGAGPVSRSGGGSHPAEDGCPGSDPVSRSGAESASPRRPGRDRQFREVHLAGITGSTSRNRVLAGTRGRGPRRRSGFAKWGGFGPCCGRLDGEGPSFAKYTSPGSLALLRETGVQPKSGEVLPRAARFREVEGVGTPLGRTRRGDLGFAKSARDPALGNEPAPGAGRPWQMPDTNTGTWRSRGEPQN